MEEEQTKLISVIEEEFARFVIDNYLVSDDNELLIRDREGEIDYRVSFENVCKVINFSQFYESIRRDFIAELTEAALKVLDKYGI